MWKNALFLVFMTFFCVFVVGTTSQNHEKVELFYFLFLQYLKNTIFDHLFKASILILYNNILKFFHRLYLEVLFFYVQHNLNLN